MAMKFSAKTATRGLIVCVTGTGVVLAAAFFLSRGSVVAEPRPLMPVRDTRPAPISSVAAPSAQQPRALRPVPFTSQAPTGDWRDPREEDACEEALVLMAVRWAQGEDLTPRDAEREIIAMSDFESATYGDFRDTSAADTRDRLIKGYLKYPSAEVRSDITTADIRDEIAKGNIVIVPVNGRMLANPFYTPPGPTRHMIVIWGYDTKTKEFITHDPGTRHGAGLRYPEHIVAVSLRDYPSAYGEPLTKTKTAMIVVHPSQNAL